MALLGFNTDFKYRGDTYHVQTEDNGVNNPVVLTLLYFKGAILASKKTAYRDLLEKPGFEKELMELMKSQHKAIMKELLAGAYDGYLGGAPAVASPAAASSPESPAAAPPPAAPVSAAPPPPPAPAPAPPAPPTPVAAATATPPPPPPRTAPPSPAQTVTPRAAAASSLSLDQAIMRYLEEHAAAAATGSAGVRH